MPDLSHLPDALLHKPADNVRPRRSLFWQIAAWLLFAASVAAALAAVWTTFPEVDWLISRQAELQMLRDSHPWQFGCCLLALMTVMCALALPGCSIVALAAGLLFGFTAGTAIVLLGSTLGATVAFLAARHLWRDAVRQRWGDRLAGIEAGLARDGAFYLFSLRVAPIIPFGLLNPLLGLSAMPTRQFFSVSLLGMFAGSAAYVYAGTTLAVARQWQDLFTPGLLAALCGLALLPWLTRALWRTTT